MNIKVTDMPMLDMYEVLFEVCPKCKAAPLGQCLEPKSGGMGGSRWIENPHPERVAKALAVKIQKEIRAA